MIQSASLTLYVTSRSDSNSLTAAVYPVLRAWHASYATWACADSSVNWTTAGCNGVGTDRSGTAAASVTFAIASGYVTTPNLTALVQGWVSDPGSNRGLLLRPQGGAGIVSYSLASAQHGTLAYRPKLTVTYSVGGTLAQAEAEVEAEVKVEAQVQTPDDTAVVTKYYTLGGQRVAMRKGDTLYYLLTDHLGSTTATVNTATGSVERQLYKPYGEPRGPSGALPTDRQFTGQRSEETALGSLYDYGARFYSPVLGRFIQADTIVPSPGNPQSLNRYAYTLNNPLRYTDPNGHWPIPPRFPIEQVILRILNNPYVKPLWQNPQIGVPVSYSAYREVKGDAPEALSLTLDWYLERGEAPREIGSDSEITQFLITSKGLQEAREQFIKGGGRDMTLAAKNAAHHEFTWEAVPELYKAIRHDNWSGSFLGSFDVEFRNLQDYEGRGKLVEVTVVNDTGWQSATKIPFTKTTIRKNVDRSEPGPGGTLWQYYRWQEVIYAE